MQDVRVWGPTRRGNKRTGIFQVRVKHAGQPEKWKSLRTRNPIEAEQAKRRIVRELEDGNEAALNERLEINKVFKAYRKDFETVVEAGTLENYRYAWLKFARYLGLRHPGVRYLDQLRPGHVVGFRDWMVSNEGGCTKRTTNDYIRNLGTVITKLTRVDAFTGKNVVLKVDRFSKRELRIERGTPTFLSLEEIPVLMREAAKVDKGLASFCALCIYAGLRHREAVMVRWDWITWPEPGRPAHEGYITIPVVDPMTGFRVKNGRARSIPLVESFVRFFLPLRGPRPMPGYIVAPSVVALGRRRYRWDVRKGFSAARKAARLPRKLCPKELRHTFASQCIINGVSLYQLMIWMGHEDVKTLAIYAHLNPGDPMMARWSAALERGEFAAGGVDDDRALQA